MKRKQMQFVQILYGGLSKMKQWRVDNYIIGPAVDAEYDDTADKLAEVLNSYERKGYKIQEIIEVREGFFRIIYTSEDETICPIINRYFDNV